MTRSGQPAMQMADRRVSKLRPSCLKSYAAGMGRRSEGMGHSNRRIERSKRRTHSGLCGSIPLGRPLGEPGSIPLVHPGLRERTPRFLSPNPPKDTDGRREDSGRGWVRELQGRWPGVLG